MFKIHSYKERVWDQKGHSVLCSLKKGSNGFPTVSLELSQIGKMLAMFSHSVCLLGTYILITQMMHQAVLATAIMITHLSLLALTQCSITTRLQCSFPWRCSYEACSYTSDYEL